MWNCKECGGEIEMHSMAVIEKSYKLKRHVGFVILKNDSIDERICISYRCTKCNNNNNNLEDIAEWEDDNE